MKPSNKILDIIWRILTDDLLGIQSKFIGSITINIFEGGITNFIIKKSVKP